ncbi:glutamate-1-semialdehyde 2,1-aminomutase [bacterium]|nr:glutamate-1-semialdehyde 2,1-aminomutase [bacterium]
MPQSEALFNDAQQVLVGGVNSPVRAFKSVGGSPIYMKEGKGPYLISEDGESYVDYVLSWGPMILGHAHHDVTAAIQATVSKGTSFGTSNRLEIDLAKAIQGFYPSCEKLRFVSSGTEATMSAVRLARGVTGRDIIVKFEGCYHGHVDSLLVAAGSGALTMGHPDSAGVPKAFAETTRVLPYNDIEAVKALFSVEGDRIAAIICEPVAGNMGVVLPEPGFLETLRGCCDQSGALLIFDEVMCGFRVSLNGAQGRFGVRPDITCLGKVIGGGMPVGAYGGRADIMDQLSPLGPVYQAGTLSGNPVAMAAGLETLTQLKTTEAYSRAELLTTELVSGMRDIIQSKGVSATITQCGTMFTLFFTDKRVTCLADASLGDMARFNHYFHTMLAGGIYGPPSAYEACFLSSVHGDIEIAKTLEVFGKAV